MPLRNYSAFWTHPQSNLKYLLSVGKGFCLQTVIICSLLKVKRQSKVLKICEKETFRPWATQPHKYMLCRIVKQQAPNIVSVEGDDDIFYVKLSQFLLPTPVSTPSGLRAFHLHHYRHRMQIRNIDKDRLYQFGREIFVCNVTVYGVRCAVDAL